MIKRLTYAEIDFEKYQNCLENSAQRNFYASRFILDHLCETWDLLIFDHYEFVMPVPIRKKYGLNFVIMPLFCQQLGVSGPHDDREVEEQFLLFLLRNYKIVYYSFHFSNNFISDLPKKKNYFIGKTEFSSLRKQYFKGRKSTVKTAQYLQSKELTLGENLHFITQNFKGLEKKSDLDKFIKYVSFLQSKNMLKLFGAFKDEQLISLAIMISTDDRLFLLGLVNDENFRSDNGASFLIDRILRENISLKSFDFMGSSIRGIEVFFKSFGSELQEYCIIENSGKDLIKNIIKKY